MLLTRFRDEGCRSWTPTSTYSTYRIGTLRASKAALLGSCCRAFPPPCSEKDPVRTMMFQIGKGIIRGVDGGCDPLSDSALSWIERKTKCGYYIEYRLVEKAKPVNYSVIRANLRYFGILAL